MSGQVFKPGDRVRVIRSGSIGSRIAAGKTGTVVRRDDAGVSKVETEEFRAAFPLAARLDGRSYVQVWSPDELELLS